MERVPKMKKDAMKEFNPEKVMTHFFETSRVPIAIVREDQEVVYVNKTFQNLTGFSREALQKARFADLWEADPGDLEAVWSRATNASQGVGGPYSGRLRLSGGDSKAFEYLVFSAEPEDGDRFFLVWLMGAVLSEEYERRRDQEKLNKAFMDAAPALMYIKSTEGVYLEINRFYQRMLGVDREAVVGRSVDEVHEPDVAKALGADDRAVLERGRMLVFEEPLRTPQGDRVLLSHKFPLFDEDGRPHALAGMSLDVTEKVTMVQQLMESEEKYRALFENAHDAIYVVAVEPDGNPGLFVEVNDAACWRLGYTMDELKQMRPSDILVNYPEKLLLFMKRLNADGHVTMELAATTKSGELFEMEVNACVTTFGGEKAFLVVARDLSERKRREREDKERERQLMQADKLITLGIMVAGVAHEVNNPNQFIVSNTLPLKKVWRDALPILEGYFEKNGSFKLAGGAYEKRKDQVFEMLDNILEGSQRINRIVEELRQYSRESPPSFEDNVDVNEVVRSGVSMLQAHIRKATDRFELNLAEPLPRVRGNRQQLGQVVVNIVQNACHALASRQDGVRVYTTYRKEEDAVAIVVEDDGSGIAPEDKGHLFDPFFTTRRTRGGVGLGLSICSTIIGQHGGAIEVDSTPGCGATFTVKLPFIEERNHV